MTRHVATLKVFAPADGGSKGRSWKWREMLRFPNISECQELAATIGACVGMCVRPVQVQAFHSDLSSSSRAGLLQSLRQAANRQGALSAVLLGSAGPAELHDSAEGSGRPNRDKNAAKRDLSPQMQKVQA